MGWDTSLRGQKTDREIAELLLALFKCGQTKVGICYTLGGVYVEEAFSRVSKKALEVIKKNAEAKINKWASVRILNDRVLYAEFPKIRKMEGGKQVIDKERRVTIEHVIPVDALYRELARRFEKSELTAEYIESLIPKMQVALIRDDENALLNKKHKSTMPAGWWTSKELDPLDRYREAGLGDDIWHPDYCGWTRSYTSFADFAQGICRSLVGCSLFELRNRKEGLDSRWGNFKVKIKFEKNSNIVFQFERDRNVMFEFGISDSYGTLGFSINNNLKCEFMERMPLSVAIERIRKAVIGELGGEDCPAIRKSDSTRRPA